MKVIGKLLNTREFNADPENSQAASQLLNFNANRDFYYHCILEGKKLSQQEKFLKYQKVLLQIHSTFKRYFAIHKDQKDSEQISSLISELKELFTVKVERQELFTPEAE